MLSEISQVQETILHVLTNKSSNNNYNSSNILMYVGNCWEWDQRKGQGKEKETEG
jgi:hypothetical protein